MIAGYVEHADAPESLNNAQNILKTPSGTPGGKIGTPTDPIRESQTATRVGSGIENTSLQHNADPNHHPFTKATLAIFILVRSVGTCAAIKKPATLVSCHDAVWLPIASTVERPRARRTNKQNK